MALRAGYKGIKKFIADKLNSLGDLDTLATDAEVAEQIATVISSNVENGEKSAKAYAIGEHFMRNGKFATATTAIAIDDTLTENTNYSVGDVGSYLSYENVEITGINSKITVDSSMRIVTKYGKVVGCKIRFTVNESLGTDTVRLFTIAPSAVNNIILPVFYRDYPLDTAGFSAFITGSGNVNIHLATDISSGTYELNGTYIGL